MRVNRKKIKATVIALLLLALFAITAYGLYDEYFNPSGDPEKPAISDAHYSEW